MTLAISIVLYHNGKELQKAIACILRSKIDLKLFLIDNSKTDELKNVNDDSRISYTFNNANLGYGAAHNIALKKSLAEQIKYHLVMNADVIFEEGTLEKIVDYMDRHHDVGALMPKVYYEDGSLQRLCKLLPTPFDLMGRRFLYNFKWAEARNRKYELHDFNHDFVLNTPSLSGSFMFLRTGVLETIGLFDERFFMYLEDYDLSRRINQSFKTLFFPEVAIVHTYNKGSYKSRKLLYMHMKSAIQYFNKWGWLMDKERERLNQEVLQRIVE